MTEDRTRVITVRLTPTEHSELKAEGPNVTAAIRARLGFENGHSDELAGMHKAIELLNARLGRLEQLAGDNL